MTTKSRRPLYWMGGLVLVVVGLLIGGLVYLAQVEIEFTSTGGRAQPVNHTPVLVGRSPPKTPAATGEAAAKPEEDWFGALTLEELLDGEEPEIIVGRVLDTDGKPVGGIMVTAAFDDDGPPDPDWEGYGVSTEDDGLFVMGGLPDRTFRLTAARPRAHARDWRTGRPWGRPEVGWVERVVVEGIRAGRRDVRIRMAAIPSAEEEFEVGIRVIGPDGKDVPAWGYTECSNEGAWSSIEGKVEPEPGQPGRVTLSGRPPIGLIIQSPATKGEWEGLPFASGFVYPIVPREEPYVVHLQRAGSIRGRVDLQGAETTANVLVRYAVLTTGRSEDPERVTDETAHGAFEWDMTGTEPDGSFRLDGLPPGRVRLLALHSSGSLKNAPQGAGVTVTVGDTDVRLSLPAHAPIRGSVDWQAAQGLEDLSFQVHVSRLEYGRPKTFWSKHIYFTDALKNGFQFETPPLPTTREYTVEVWASGQPPRAHGTHGPRALRRVERVRPGGSRVFFLLAALPGVQGRVERADGISAGGGIELKAIRASAPALVRAAGLAGDDADEWEFFTQPEPRVLPAPGDGPHYATTDPEGRFAFPGLRSGRYIVWAQGARLLEVATGLRDAVVRLGTGRRLTGRVRAKRGDLPPGFVVEARSTAEESELLASSTVRSDGYFDVRGLADDAVDLSVYNAADPTDNRVAFLRPVLPGTKRLDVVLSLGNQVSGRVVDETGARTVGAVVTFRSRWEERRVRVARDGTFQIAGLIAPTCDVRVVLPDGRHAELRAVAATEVTLVVP